MCNYLEYSGRQLQPYVEFYHEGSPCLCLLRATGAKGYVISCEARKGDMDVPATLPDKGCIWLKDWDNNRPAVEFLVDKEYLVITGNIIQEMCGTRTECRVTQKLFDLISNRDDPNVKEWFEGHLG